MTHLVTSLATSAVSYRSDLDFLGKSAKNLDSKIEKFSTALFEAFSKVSSSVLIFNNRKVEMDPQTKKERIERIAKIIKGLCIATPVMFLLNKTSILKAILMITTAFFKIREDSKQSHQRNFSNSETQLANPTTTAKESDETTMEKVWKQLNSDSNTSKKEETSLKEREELEAFEEIYNSSIKSNDSTNTKIENKQFFIIEQNKDGTFEAVTKADNDSDKNIEENSTPEQDTESSSITEEGLNEIYDTITTTNNDLDSTIDIEISISEQSMVEDFDEAIVATDSLNQPIEAESLVNKDSLDEVFEEIEITEYSEQLSAIQLMQQNRVFENSDRKKPQEDSSQEIAMRRLSHYLNAMTFNK